MALHGGQMIRPGWFSGVPYLQKASGKIDELQLLQLWTEDNVS